MNRQMQLYKPIFPVLLSANSLAIGRTKQSGKIIIISNGSDFILTKEEAAEYSAASLIYTCITLKRNGVEFKLLNN